ncbi:MAG: hypothetical protein QXJ23_10715 [Thermofilum sp.]|uniref:hypothetical protein n=1 Tax=Thermofilum sp. TaxID=1961369 RepID=UPI003171384F
MYRQRGGGDLPNIYQDEERREIGLGGEASEKSSTRFSSFPTPLFPYSAEV